MNTIIQDIIAAVNADTDLAPLITDAGRVQIFYRNPTTTPTSPYITFVKTKQKDPVRDRFLVQFVLFHTDSVVLDQMSQLLQALFDEKNIINDVEYYRILFLTSMDETVRLKNGQIFNMLNFEFLITN